MKGRVKFMPPVFARGELDIREDDKCKLSFVDGDAIQMHPHDFGVEELITGDGLLVEVKLE